MSINSVQVEGNLVAEPETKATGTGRTVVKFTIAENVRVKDSATNEWKDGTPNFYDCEFWPNDPQYWLKRLGKGVGVVIFGHLTQDKWEKDGQKYSRIKIIVEKIISKWLPELQATAPKAEEKAPDFTDDIPF
jgi:single-strand DNA-binding protein